MKKPQKPSASKPKGRRKKAAPIPKDTPAINPRHHPDAAGIDVGAEEFVAALPPDRSEQSVRTFPTYTSGVEALRDWLQEHNIKTAALESTGNYWIMLYDKLTAAGIDVYLVNARHVKGVPGKKTDVCDAQWLQQLHAAGLLRKSFRPALEIVPLRYLMRHRSEMVEHAATQLHLMQKVLTEMNLKLHHVFSDIDGAWSGEPRSRMSLIFRVFRVFRVFRSFSRPFLPKVRGTYAGHLIRGSARRAVCPRTDAPAFAPGFQCETQSSR